MICRFCGTETTLPAELKSLYKGRDKIMSTLQAASSHGAQRGKKTHKGLQTNNTYQLLLMASPAVVLIFILNYIPMFGVFIAFKNINLSKGFFGSEWVGLKNFKFLFTSSDAARITVNTVSMNLLFIITGTIVSVAFALMLNEIGKRWIVKTLQTTYFFPYFVSWVVAGFMFYSYFNVQYGMLNNLLLKLGFQTVEWYSKPQYWPVILLFVYLWKYIGYFSIIYYAGIMGIDCEYYEAAAIDGASKLDMVTKITIPLLSPLIIVMLLIQLGKIFYSDFGLFYFIPGDNGALYSTTDVIDTYVFRSFKVLGDIGMSSAAGLYQSLVGFVLVMLSNIVVRKYSPDNSLF
jgi:putative aldouronate transport system permease protein